jgi:hypothetical protein
VARPIDALASGECRGTPIRGHSSQLTKVPITIVGKHVIDCHGRIDVSCERIEDASAVSRVDPHRLRRDRTNAGPNPGRHRADREVLRLNGAPDFAGHQISRHNRERSGVNGHCTTLPVVARPRSTSFNEPKIKSRERLMGRGLGVVAELEGGDSGESDERKISFRGTLGYRS